MIDLRAVFQETFGEVVDEKPCRLILKPEKGKLGLQDHEKVFCVDHKGLGDFFDMRGIDRVKGCDCRGAAGPVHRPCAAA